MSIDELVINDSFISYCLGKDEDDIAYWENYLLFFPEQKDNLEQARQIVLGISVMLRREREQSPSSNRLFRSGRLRRMSLAAAVFLLVCAGLYWLFLHKLAPSGPEKTLAHRPPTPGPALLYCTRYAEKKNLQLPDGSRVVLSPGSTLRLAEGFPETSRELTLSGQAFFEIKQQADHPCIIHLSNFDIRVLGTSFNVKAYPEDRSSETSLIQGKIEIALKDRVSRSLILHPREKLVIDNKPDLLADSMKAHRRGADMPAPALPRRLLPLTPSVNGLEPVETAWTEGRLEIDNQPFTDIRADLERRYNVHIVFRNEEVAGYRFTANFRDEDIRQVLQALQWSYPFHYQIVKDSIMISK